MNILLAVIGILILVLTIGDILLTTFLEGGGPLTVRMCEGLSRIVLFIHHRANSRKILVIQGLVTVISTVLVWFLLIWAGWTLVFSADPSSVVLAKTMEPANTWERIYYVGYTVFTLGLGDYQPQGRIWQIATVIASGMGLFFMGLAIAYLVPVVSAVTQKRQLAVTIWGLGKTPDEIIIRAWNGADAMALVPHLISLTTMLALLGESHATYPILHYFHSRRRSSSIAPRVAALDEALTILECGLKQRRSLAVPSLGSARVAISEFLLTLKGALVESASEVPPCPALKTLRDAGVPVVEDEALAQALEGLKARRRLLLALVRNEGWDWGNVWPREELQPCEGVDESDKEDSERAEAGV